MRVDHYPLGGGPVVQAGLAHAAPAVRRAAARALVLVPDADRPPLLAIATTLATADPELRAILAVPAN